MVLEDGPSIEVTFRRIWTNATPQLESANTGHPNWSLGDAMSQILSISGLPPNENVAWVGVALTLTNNGQQPIALGSSYRDTPSLDFESSGIPSALEITGFSVGIPGCTFPFPASLNGQLNVGQTLSGCVALAVPVDTTISTVGFNFEGSEMGRPHVAQWSVPSQ
jgi:hypothetical protein